LAAALLNLLKIAPQKNCCGFWVLLFFGVLWLQHRLVCQNLRPKNIIADFELYKKNV
jgi:hypothetical protein